MNDIWWRQLAREVDRRGYKDVEIIAAGMQGINTRIELDVAKKVIPKFKPDLVIWGYIPNDADELSRLDTDHFDSKLLFPPPSPKRIAWKHSKVFIPIFLSNL